MSYFDPSRAYFRRLISSGTSIIGSAFASYAIKCSGYQWAQSYFYLSNMVNDDSLTIYWADDASGLGAKSLAALIASGEATLVNRQDMDLQPTLVGVTPEYPPVYGVDTFVRLNDDGTLDFQDATCSAMLTIRVRRPWLIFAWTTGQTSGGSYEHMAWLQGAEGTWLTTPNGGDGQTLPDGFDPYFDRYGLVAG